MIGTAPTDLIGMSEETKRAATIFRKEMKIFFRKYNDKFCMVNELHELSVGHKLAESEDFQLCHSP